MHYGVNMENYGEKWREAMRNWSGEYSQRTTNDGEERKFWHEFMKNRLEYHQDEYAKPIAAEMKKIILPYHPDSILEIGPGWGNYTFDLANICNNMYCTDISSDVLSYIIKNGKKKGKNIHTIESKWEDYNAVSCDVVVAFNCFYRMMEIENCLKKINDTAQKLCVIGMTSGPEQPYYKEIEEKLDLKINYHRLDYIYLVNLLYQLGIDCCVKIIPLKKTYFFNSLHHAAEQESRRILSGQYTLTQIEQILEKYLHKDLSGKYFYEHHFFGALLYWEPKNNRQY
ncbi:MAG: methyltransferase domain-containing protein [Eubacteriales bacterium]|nr:methyltransferase domain-containing protein [Eubacteriales bacterium]